MCIPTFVDFFLSHLFFSLFLSFSFSFLSVSPVAGPYGIFFLLFPFAVSFFRFSRPIISNFFSSGLFSLVNGTICNVTPTDRGRQEKLKQTNKHEQRLGLTKSRGRYATLCIPDSIYGLTLAWVTSENSTKLLESDSS